jgi:hypothetical protein
MLCVNSYTQGYIDECRSRMESQLAAYKALITTARAKTGTSNSALKSAVDSFEPLFYNNLVVVLDSFFVHRSRTLEKKDGNPLNEVRMVCNSILQNHSVMSTDKTIKFSPEKSILKLHVGDEIKLTESDFVLLFRAFFAEMEAKFVT